MWIVNALSIVCPEMLKLTRNNQNIEMFGVPPNTLPLVTYEYFVIGYYYITTCHSKHLRVGLMLSDGMVHFLKMKKTCNKSTKTILWLSVIFPVTWHHWKLVCTLSIRKMGHPSQLPPLINTQNKCSNTKGIKPKYERYLYFHEMAETSQFKEINTSTDIIDLMHTSV